jgi:CBS domain containing-hemolysin-like protein
VSPLTPLLLFLLACAAVYVGTIQAAFSALMRLSLRLRAEGADTSEHLEAYLEHPLRLFVPARVLLGLIIIVAAELVGSALGLVSLERFGLTLGAMLLFVLVCEQIIPGLIVRGQPQRVLELLLPSFDVIAAPMRPLTRFIERRASRRERPLAEEPPPGQAEPDATRSAAPDEAHHETDDHELLRSIVDFSNRLVREVMTPRPDIVAIRAEATLEELRAFFREQEYSRIPVFKESLDNVLGFVFVKDLIRRLDASPATPVTELMRPAYFVPETKRVAELLKEFQRKQVQSAIVVDEYGGTAGLVTLEDLLEEIVGEIRDEYDVELEPFVPEGEHAFLVAGRANFDEVAEKLRLETKAEGFETFGGYLLSHLGRVPSVGETLEVDGLCVEVLEAERRRIHKVRVRRPVLEPEERTERVPDPAELSARARR